MKRFLMMIGFFLVLTGCYDPDLNEKFEAKMLAAHQEEEKAEQERIKEQEEVAKKWDEIEKRKQWEIENTDKIHYRISRYSEDGIFVDEDKFNIYPQSDDYLKTLDLHNRGWNDDLDKDFHMVVDSSFFGIYPSGPFNKYYILWEKGSRDNIVRVEAAHINVSGW